MLIEEYPVPLLTVRRISSITGLPVSVIRRVLDENPAIRPSALADFRPVYGAEALDLFANAIRGHREVVQ